MIISTLKFLLSHRWMLLIRGLFVLFMVSCSCGGSSDTSSDNELDLPALVKKGLDCQQEGLDQEAVECFKQAAQGGEASAQFSLGRVYNEGKGVDRDQDKAIDWLKKAIDQGHAEAELYLTQLYAKAHEPEQTLGKVVEIGGKSLSNGEASTTKNQGGAIHQVSEGVALHGGALKMRGKETAENDPQLIGLGVQKPALKEEWISDEGAVVEAQHVQEEQADIDAKKETKRVVNFDQNVTEIVDRDDTYRKAYNFYYGENGVTQSYEQSAALLQKIAEEQNDASAQYNLGRMYLINEGVSQDYQKAFKWLKMAADQDHPEAQLLVGRMYLIGKGMERNDKIKAEEYFDKAIASYEKLADEGDMHAQNEVGCLYDQGIFVKKDLRRAFEYFEKSANQGYPDALFNVAMIYEEGQEGVSKDVAQAKLYYISAAAAYQKVANQGNAEAQYSLGSMYAKGEGVQEDIREALKWLKKAAAQEHKEAKHMLTNMERNVPKLIPDQSVISFAGIENIVHKNSISPKKKSSTSIF